MTRARHPRARVIPLSVAHGNTILPSKAGAAALPDAVSLWAGAMNIDMLWQAEARSVIAVRTYSASSAP